jgi:glycine cleavage system pyridoxal-binding protein P
MIRAMRAFLLGVLEFRETYTTSMPGDLIETYDRGREWAHRLTLRRYEQY